jgi:hypothetical protein
MGRGMPRIRSLGGIIGPVVVCLEDENQSVYVKFTT